MEQLNIPKEYKDAYNEADLIARYSPEILNHITIPEKELDNYGQGFKDRLLQYQKEKEQTKSFDLKQLQNRYEKDPKGIFKDTTGKQERNQDKDDKTEKER